MSEADVLLYDVDDGVATITLNRPDRRNAVNAALGQAMNEALVRAAGDKSVRALILTGAGDGFCAGGDADRLQDVADGKRQVGVQISPNEPDPIFQIIPDAPPELRSRYTFAQAMPIPVIAAVNGPAVGAGLAFALSADIRLASPNAAFMAGFVRIGAIPELGLSWTITNLIGLSRARDMLISGRRIDAEEALRWGLISQIHPREDLLPAARTLAREIAQRSSPRSVRHIKKFLRAVPSQSFADAFEMSRVETAPALESADFKEGVSAMREKRIPNFPRE
ncbi:MAG: enoyl-CoA hydratase-related protein [Caulobacterales bacterium]